MGRWFVCKPLVVVLSILSLSAARAEQDPEGGWTRTKTDFSLVMLFTQQLYPCLKSAKNYLGCVEMINGMGESLEPQHALIPKYMANMIPNMKVNVLADVGSLQLVTVESWGDDPSTAAKRAEQTRAKAKMLQQAAFANYEDKLGIQFEQLAFDLLQKKKPSISGARAVGNAVNRGILVHDGHGRIVPMEYNVESMRNADNSFSGIGATLQLVDKRVVIAGTIETSPAEAAGLLANDVILTVNKVEVTGKALDEVVNLIKGPAGSTVTLELERNGQALEPVKIVRNKVVLANVTAKPLTDMDKKVLHVRLRSFDESGCDRIKDAIKKMDRDVKGLILDLRDNGGGLLDTSVCLGGLFVGKKNIVTVRKVFNGQTMDRTQFNVSEEDQITNLPMVVLINGGSASASEIVSGALQDYQRAYIMGTRSFGKATVQSGTVFPLQKDLLVYATTARFYSPSDRTNQIVGIRPDFEVFTKPNPTEDEKYVLTEGDLVPSALPPTGREWVQPRPEAIEKLTASCFAGKSEAAYEAKQGKADYQLLKAQELLACPAAM